jgi:hypothetical protein
MDNSRPITAPFMFNQNYQGRITDDSDVMTVSCFLVKTYNQINRYAHQLEQRRDKVVDWSSWSKINEKVIWND